jgi:hypothetical protein
VRGAAKAAVLRIVFLFQQYTSPFNRITIFPLRIIFLYKQTNWLIKQQTMIFAQITLMSVQTAMMFRK